ncbi:MAG: hypothetical protein NZ959_05650 [Armatimonadetes bacterium]|nr:hypothetical protein [Armatimonadota bacterium]MDW8122410.1 hypothetical protein [Armatimonadota bacterium]
MKIATSSSFIYFVYPFLFDAEKFQERAEAIRAAQWQGREQTLLVWRQQEFPEEDLLAYVQRYLNPPPGTWATAYLWKMDHQPLHSPFGWGADARWNLIIPKKEIPFRWGDVPLNGLTLDGVQLALFSIGVAFLSFATTVKSDDISDWLDFLHYFQFIRGQRKVGIRAQRRTGKDQWEPFFPEPAGGVKEHPQGEGTFGDILESILNTGARIGERHSDNAQPDNKWWSEVFVPGQLMPFAVLYADSTEVTDRQIGELLYRVRNFFPANRVLQPTPDDLSYNHPSLLSYGDKMWFVCTLEGGAFIAVNAPDTDFFRRELPRHLKDQYFLLFLIALHQRFALMSLSQDVSEHWLQREERVQTFERIRDRLLNFTARGYFVQVMQREHHHRVYEKWQQVFQLEQLYQEVNDEVREMHEYALSESTKRLENRLNLLGALIGVPSLVIGFLGINIYNITIKGDGLPLWLTVLLVSLGFAFGGFAWWLLSKR